MNYIAISGDQYLEHHGVKGQKWGVRRYQDKTGGLTDKGIKRYRADVSTAKKLQSKINKLQTKAIQSTQKSAKKSVKSAKLQSKALKLQTKGNFDKAAKFMKKAYKKNEKLAKYTKASAKYQKKALKSSILRDNINRAVSDFKSTYGSKYDEKD